ncbi:unnamed protein product, partial [marine sediment metagenome]
MLFLILIGAMIFSRFLAVSQLPFEASDWIGGLPISPTAILAVLLFIYLIGGCVLDALAMILLTIPIFFPTAMALGFDPIWLGVLVVIVMEMGLITPP